jgi:hypothetical protein
MSSNGLLVCTTCFGLTSAGQGMQRCSCEVYQAYPGVDCPSGYHLCFMCAAIVAGGTGRYSWEVCEECQKFNRSLKIWYGFSLPLGRHSIMNGLAIPLVAQGSEQEEGIVKLLDFLDQAGSISDWGKLQARTLFESVPMWRKEPFIKLDTWEAKFHLSKVKATSRSVQTFKDYLRVDSFEELQ